MDAQEKHYGETILKALAILLAVSIVGCFLFYCLFVNSIDTYEFGYKYDRMSGKIEFLPRNGFFITAPIETKIYGIDTRPGQVCLTAGVQANNTNGINNRILNCKLVQFDPKGFNDFIARHGRGDYNHDKITEILKIYAFDQNPEQYPFLKILKGTD